jgi:hypothetical protein
MTTKAVSSNPAHEEVYLILVCDKVSLSVTSGISVVIALCSDFPTNKTDRHDIMSLSTIFQL